MVKKILQMVELIRQTKESKYKANTIDHMAVIDIHITKANRRMEDLVTSLGEDPLEFMLFCHLYWKCTNYEPGPQSGTNR